MSQAGTDATVVDFWRFALSNLTRDTLVGSGFWGGFFVGIPWCWGCAGTL